MSEKLKFFNNPSEFNQWLAQHHDEEVVLWVGFYKVSTGKASMSWEESVKEALCFGWIDGIRKTVDEESYKIRFTPRRKGSNWSKKNIAMVKELIKEGRMHPSGLKAFKLRNEHKPRRASYELGEVQLKKEYENAIRKNKKAWRFFQELPPGYTKTSVHWIMSAKKEETRLRRLRVLIQSCEEGTKIPLLRR